MNTHIECVLFVGPSLSATDLAGWCGPQRLALGPASCGDLYRACQLRPSAIGLIDGYFDHRLAVWHKEVLWALARGIHVYGAASMGALRAAELAEFGMIGVGRVFEQFQDRLLEDDDEVAVVHEPADRGYVPRSEAMVNLRATLDCAARQGALSRASADASCAALKRLFYPERSAGALRHIVCTLLGPAERTRFEAWLAAHGIVNQKLRDARALLERISADLEQGLCAQPHRAAFRFANTDCWQALRARIDQQSGEPRTLE